jgi:hypothetical protein
MDQGQQQTEKLTLAWRGLLIAAAVSVLLGLMLIPTDAGPRLYGRVYIPLFVLILAVGVFAKKKSKRAVFRTAIALLIALPLLTIPLMIAIY